MEFEILELRPVAQEPFGLRGLAPEVVPGALDLRDDVGQSEQVLPRLLHLALGLLAALLVLGDPRGLLDEEAAILGPGAHDLPDPALLDDGVGLGSDASAEEQIGHVSQAHGRPVDEVLAGAVAKQAPGDGDLRVLCVLGRQVRGFDAVRVVEGDGHLGEAGRPTRIGAVEDHILHRLAAELARALLPHAPADRVHDVGLAAAVRPDDADDVVVEMHHGLLDEGLEPADLELLDVHRAPETTPRRVG